MQRRVRLSLPICSGKRGNMEAMRARLDKLLHLAIGLAIGISVWMVPTAQAQVPADTARIHYNRAAADYAGWVIYTWTGAANPSPSFPGNQGPSGTDTFGVYYDVALGAGATRVDFVLKIGASQTCHNDIALA